MVTRPPDDIPPRLRFVVESIPMPIVVAIVIAVVQHLL
jgi:hypothetical protein